MENSLISPSTKRKIRERVMRDDRRVEQSNPPCSLYVAPTKSEYQPMLEVDDFGEKASMCLMPFSD